MLPPSLPKRGSEIKCSLRRRQMRSEQPRSLRWNLGLRCRGQRLLEQSLCRNDYSLASTSRPVSAAGTSPVPGHTKRCVPSAATKFCFTATRVASFSAGGAQHENSCWQIDVRRNLRPARRAGVSPTVSARRSCEQLPVSPGSFRGLALSRLRQSATSRWGIASSSTAATTARSSSFR